MLKREGAAVCHNCKPKASAVYQKEVTFSALDVKNNKLYNIELIEINMFYVTQVALSKTWAFSSDLEAVIFRREV